MNRREFLSGAGIGALGCAAVGVWWTRRAHARSELERKLIAATMPELISKSHTELRDLPRLARDEIRLWFHGKCLNAAEFVGYICSDQFAERLASCQTEELKQDCLHQTFAGAVTSDAEVVNHVTTIAREIGAVLEHNWADCCTRISANCDVHIRAYPHAPFGDFATRLEPLIRQQLSEAAQQARSAGDRPLLGETIEKIGVSAIQLLPMASVPKVAVPVFVWMAYKHLYAYVSGRLSQRQGDYKTAISSRLALLGNRVGDEFETEAKRRIADLHGWQETAVRLTARAQAEQLI